MADYKSIAAAMARLSEVDRDLQGCHSKMAHIDRSVEELRRQLEATSVDLDARKRAIAPPAGSMSGNQGTGDLFVEESQYRKLFQTYEDLTHTAQSRRQVLQRELGILEGRRSKLLSQIPTDLLALYDALNRAGKMPAIVPLVSGFCGGCRSGIGAEVYQSLELGREALRCPRCERFLILPSWQKST